MNKILTCAFERIATTFNGPKEMWSMFLQYKLVGKAQDVCSSLAISELGQFAVPRNWSSSLFDKILGLLENLPTSPLSN